jgi:pantoate--beta-alanine ligase
MGRPDLALFGEKDFQQLAVIRRMVEDLCIPVEVVGVPTVREPDGLAMSSRNGYLTAEERERAPALYRALQAVAEAVEAGGSDLAALERAAAGAIDAAGLRTDYVSVRRVRDLALPGAADEDLVVLAAAYLGRARLIDNLRVRRHP